MDLVPDNNARNGYLAVQAGHPDAQPLPGLRIGFCRGVAADLRRGPRPRPGAPDFGGIAEAFNNPLQTIRDDFGTLRLDHIFSQKDTLSAIYTIDDSADFTPTSTNAYSTDVESLREQVASLEETHVFSPTLVNTARVGFSRAGYFFTGEPTPGTPAADLPGFLAGDPIGALVVGGSAASNPTAQLSLAGSNNGSNLRVARNLFTYEDQLVVHLWPPSVHFRRMVPASAVQRTSGAEPIRTSHLHQSANASARNHWHPVVRSHADAARLAVALWRAVRSRTSSA